MTKKNMILFAIGAVAAYLFVTRRKVAVLTVDSFENDVPNIIDAQPGFTPSAVAGVRG